MKKSKDVDICFKLIGYLLNPQCYFIQNVQATYVHFMDERAPDFIGYMHLCKYVYYWRMQKTL